MNNTIKWTGAIVLSLLVHAGAARLFEPGEKPPELATVAGGEEMEVAVLGNAFEETILSGDPDQEIEPDEVEPTEVEPEPVEVAEVPPVQSEITSETPTDIIPTEADVVLPAEEMPPVTAEQPEITATVAPVETVIPEEKPEEIKPEPEKKPEPKKEKPEKEKPQKKPVKKKAGDKGNQVERAQRGQNDGVENAVSSSNASKKGKVARALGNGAETRYSGRVRAKVNRNFRYPKSASRGMKGSVTVTFTVTGSGGLAGVRMVRGSGSPILDEAALNAVRKAAPFPPIPEGGKDPWTFSIPLVYK